MHRSADLAVARRRWPLNWGAHAPRCAAWLAVAGLLTSASPARATLSGIELAMPDSTVGASTVHGVAVTTAGGVPVGGSLRVIYPGGFDLSNVTLGATTGFAPAVPALTIVGQVAVITCTADSVAAGPLSVQLLGVTNSTIAAAYAVGVETRDAAEVIREGPGISTVFHLQPGPVSPSASSFSGGPPAVADGGSAVSLTVKLRDAFGNALAGVDSSSVVLGVVGAPLAVEKLASRTATDGSLGIDLRTTVAGDRALGVSAGNIALDDSVTVAFLAGPPDAGSSIAEVEATATADLVDDAAITVTIRDAFGNPVADVDSASVAILVQGSQYRVQKLAPATDALGVLAAALQSSRAELKSVTVELLGQPIGAPALVTFRPGLADHLEFVADGGDTLVAGAAGSLALTVRDAFGNRVTDYAGAAELSSDTAGPGANVSWSSAGAGVLTPLAPGVASYAFAASDSGTAGLGVADTRAEPLQLQVVAGPLQAQLTLTVVPAAPQQLELVDGNAQSAPVATALGLPLRVRATDAFGNPVAKRSIAFTASADGTVDSDLSLAGNQGSAETAADGVARCDRWALATQAGPQSLTATADFGDTVVFGALGTPGPLAALGLEPQGSASLAAGSALTVAARARDAYDNGVPGVEVTLFVVDALDGTLRGVGETDSLGVAQQRGVTGSDGRVRVEYLAAISAGRSDRLDAVAPGIVSASVPDLVITSIPSVATSLRVLGPTSGVGAGIAAPLSVALVDAFGNSVGSTTASVVLEAEPASGILFAAAAGGPFSAPGTFAVTGLDTLWWRGGPAGSHLVRARDEAGVLAPDSTDVVVVAATDVARLDVTAPGSTVAGATFVMTVEGYDAWDNLATGATLDFSIDLVDAADTTQVLTAAPAVASGALSGGTFSTPFQRIDRAGTMRLRVSGAGAGYLGPAMTVQAGSAWELAAASPDTLQDVVAGDAIDVAVEVRDQFGNAVAAVPVDVVFVQNGTLEVVPTPTDALGRSTARLRTATATGSARLRLAILDGAPAALETQTFTAVTRSGPVARLSALTGSSTLVAGSATAVDVAVFDAHGNPVLDATDLVELQALGAGAWVAPALAVLAGGRLSVALHDTTVGTTRVVARLQSAPAVEDTTDAVLIVPAALHRIAAVADTVLAAPAATDTSLRALVTDRFGNPVPGASVRVELLAAPAGALLRDPIAPDDDGLTLTDASGVATATLELSALVGEHRVRLSILDRTPSDLESAAWRVTSTAGAPATLEVDAPLGPWTAGSSSPVTLELRDAAGNRVPSAGNVTLVLSQPGAVATPNPVPLLGGVGGCDVVAFAVGTLTLQATLDGQPGVVGQLSQRTIIPAPPAGGIAVPVVDPATNTANGLAVTRLVAGPVQDVFGNVVAVGTPVTITADLGLLLSEDLDASVPGVQRQTDGAGQVEARLAAPVAAGTATVGFTAGAAAGSAQAEFETPAALAYDGGLTPTIVAPGSPSGFTLRLRNAGAVDAHLASAATTFELEDGGGTTFVAGLVADTTVPAGASADLSFTPTVLSAQFRPGPRRPLVRAGGVDEHGQPVMAWVVLPDGALAVSALAVLGTTVSPVEAVVGDTVTVDVIVRNTGAAAVLLTAVDLSPMPAGEFPMAAQDPLPELLPGAQQVHRTRLRIGPATLAGDYRFEARVAAETGGSFFLAPLDTSTVPLRVRQSALLHAVAGSVVPPRVSHGSSVEIAARVRNTGGVSVSIDPAQSRARIGEGTGAWSAAPTQPVALAAGAEAELRFGPAPVDPRLGAGTFDLVLELAGTEAGRAFADTLVFALAVSAEGPAQLAFDAPPLSPSLVSLGVQVRFESRVANLGQATVMLDALNSRLRVGEPAASRLTTALDPLGPTSLASGTAQLRWLPLDLPLDLALGTPPAVLELRGTQNGLPFALDLPLADGALTVQQPAALQIVATVSSQATITAGQARGWTAAVALRNNGQAALAVDPAPARTRMDLLLDGMAATGFVVRSRGTMAGGDLLLSAGEVDTLVFDVTTSGPDPGTLALLPAVEAVDVNSQARVADGSADGGSGAVVVQAPAQLAEVRSRSLPDTLSAGRLATWTARLLVTNPGGSEVRLAPLAPATGVSGSFEGSPWPLAASLQPATFLGSGDDRLAPGATDSLQFQLQGAPALPGTLRLTGRVSVIEQNSARVLADSASTDVAVQAAVRLAVDEIGGRAVGSIVAPDPDRIEVVAGQLAEVDVRLVNLGGGVADGVQLRVDTDSGRLGRIETHPSVRDTVLLRLQVAAAGSSTVEWLRVRLMGASDRWGGAPASIDPAAAVDSIQLVTVQPAALIAEQVQPRNLALQPITSITAGQTQDFVVDLALHNAGEAPVVLTSPRPDQLQVRIGGLLQNDYVVQAPTALLGRGDLLLPGGAHEILRFLVERAGAMEGAAQVRVSAVGHDAFAGDPLAAQAEASLDLQTAAGLRILRTLALNPRAPDSRVNAGQVVRARVVLSNSGQEAIANLSVGLAGQSPTPSSAAPVVLPRLAAGGVDSVEFDVTVTPTLGSETLTARVLGAISENTGQPVLELAPQDDTAPLWVQRPVALEFGLTLPWSADPLGASVTPGQRFVLRVALDRAPPIDEQGDWQPASVDLTQLVPFVLDPAIPLPLALDPAQAAVDVSVLAPPQLGLFPITGQLTSALLDPNDPTRSVLVTAPTASVQLDVSGGGGFTACGLAVVEPAGAIDATISTAQQFVVRGMVQAPANLQQRTLRLLLPNGMALPGGNPLRSLPAGVDTASWTVRAPDSPALGQLLRLVASASDLQSGAAVAETCAVLMVDVVQSAAVTAGGGFAAPASARDQGQVYPGATVTVRGWLTPSGAAALTGTSSLRLELPAGYAFEPGSSALAALPTPADTATWLVRAPGTPGAGVDAFLLRLSDRPRDANSGLEVGDPSATLTLPLATIQSLVQLRAGDAPGVGPIVGDQQLSDRMLLRLHNESSAPVRWTRLEVAIVDDSGTPLGAPEQTVAEIALVADPVGTVLAVQSVAGNPVVFAPDVTAAAGEAIAVHVAVRAAGGDGFVPFALRIAAGALAAEALDAAPVGVQLADLDGVPRASVTSAVAVRAPATLAAAGHSYPNPFVPSRGAAVIAYTLAETGSVEIGIFDLLGTAVRAWRFSGADPQAAAGVHDGDVTWDGTNGRGQAVRSGVYVCRIRGAGQEALFRIAVTR